MSPTSYQTAPPRIKIITQRGGAVSKRQHGATSSAALAFLVVYCALIEVDVPLTAHLLSFASIHNFLRINRFFVDLLFQNFPIFTNQEVDAARGFVFVEVDSVLAGNIASPITQQREGNSNLVGKSFIGKGAVHAHTQNLSVGCFQLFQIRLEGLHLCSSTTSKCKNVESYNQVALAAILAQTDVLKITTVEILQLEVRSDISDLQFHGSRLGLALCKNLGTDYRDRRQPNYQQR